MVVLMMFTWGLPEVQRGERHTIRCFIVFVCGWYAGWWPKRMGCPRCHFLHSGAVSHSFLSLWATSWTETRSAVQRFCHALPCWKFLPAKVLSSLSFQPCGR
jgi:dolichyl-phosphate-mannose--protein O-mannosyl transferase